MEILLISIRIALSTVFAFAAYGKLLDLDGTHNSVKGFGVGDKTAKIISFALPLTELLISIGLLINYTYLVAAIAFGALMLGFTAVLIRRLNNDEQGDCHCFGQISTEPISGWTIARNLVLLALASFLIITSFNVDSIDLFPERVDGAQSIFLILLLHIGLVIIHLIASNTRAKKELADVSGGHKKMAPEGVTSPVNRLPIGTKLPQIEQLIPASGEKNRLTTPLLLVFVSPECSPCKKLIPDLSTSGKNILVVSKGLKEDSQKVFEEIPDGVLVFDETQEFSTKCGVAWTPTALVFDDQMRLATKPAVGDSRIRALLESFPDEFGLETEYSALGKELPLFDEIERAAKESGVPSIAGKESLLIYWDEKCSFCLEIATELDSVEETDANIVFFTTTDATEVSKPPKNTIFIDDDDFPKSLGLKGTPTAVLIDDEKKVISEPAVGADEIRAILGI